MGKHFYSVIFAGGLIACLGLPATAQGLGEGNRIVQEQSLKITGVSVRQEGGTFQVLLEAPEQRSPLPEGKIQGNTLYFDIPNAMLSLTNRQDFRLESPSQAIARITVTQVSPSFVRVQVDGVNQVPPVTLAWKTPETVAQTEEIDLIVTTDREQGYRIPNATTGTKTDTPLRDVPFSVQTVPKELLQDRGVNTFAESLRTVSGVIVDGSERSPFELFTIRGFSSGFSGASILRNGLRDETSVTSNVSTFNIDRIEVLKGPSSALFGQGSFGGIPNIITKQPLSTPLYRIEGQFGSFDTYSGGIDLSGPLDQEGNFLYRLNAGVYTTGTFVDFFDIRRYTIAPVLSTKLGENTKLSFEAEYTISEQPNNRGLPARGTVLPNPNGEIPINRFTGETAFDFNNRRAIRVGYALEHKFDENWQIQNAFRAVRLLSPQASLFPLALSEDGRTLERGLFFTTDQKEQEFIVDTFLTGKFKTGSIDHKLVFGFDLSRNVYSASNEEFEFASIDLFSPTYRGAGSLGRLVQFLPLFITTTDTIGLYLQDQITLTDSLKLLLGGRFDVVSQQNGEAGSPASFQENNAFSPRIGIVYQPIQPVSLYASYGESFLQAVGTAFDRTFFEPEVGRQYEVGIKADLSESLTATLAYFDITRSNVLTTDPANPNFSIQTGEQNSRGVELDIAGQISPGWKVTAAAAYTDARITADNTFAVGNRLNNVPEFSASIWSTYEIQEGNLKGLGFGLGAFYVGDRQGDLANSFQVPSYIRTDAAIYYRNKNMRLGLNFENLFNVRYFENAESDLRVFPGAPFTLRGTVSWQF